MSKTIEEKLASGYIHINSILEIVGKPKEHVEATFNDYIAQMEKNQKWDVLSKTVHEVIEVDGSQNLFSTFAEIEVLLKDMGALYDFCFECMPASVEIVAPVELKLKARHASAAINDLLGKIHQLDMHAKQMTQQNSIYIENLQIAIQNAILIFLAQKPHTIQSISVAVGVAPLQLKPILDKMVEATRIVTVGDEMYAIAGMSITQVEKEKTAQKPEAQKKQTESEEVIKLGKKDKKPKK